MRDALTIVTERMAAIRTEPKSIDARIDQKELLKKLSPLLYEDAMNFKQEFGEIRVRNARPI